MSFELSLCQSLSHFCLSPAQGFNLNSAHFAPPLLYKNKTPPPHNPKKLTLGSTCFVWSEVVHHESLETVRTQLFLNALFVSVRVFIIVCEHECVCAYKLASGAMCIHIYVPPQSHQDSPHHHLPTTRV